MAQHYNGIHFLIIYILYSITVLCVNFVYRISLNCDTYNYKHLNDFSGQNCKLCCGDGAVVYTG